MATDVAFDTSMVMSLLYICVASQLDANVLQGSFTVELYNEHAPKVGSTPLLLS